MSGDHNQYQKDKSYLDGMDRYKQVRELVKDPSLRVTEIAWKTGYNKGHVSRLRKEAMRQELCREEIMIENKNAKTPADGPEYERGFVDGMQRQMQLHVNRVIKTWHERCEEHPDHQERIISERMIQARMQEEIDELRQALETEQEPVAWASSLDFDDDDQEIIPAKDKGKLGTSNCDMPLYTAPPKREWVGLTEKEVKAIANKRNDYGLPMTGRMWVFVADLTDKLKEKNHG